MKIQDHIRQHFISRLKNARALVIYDPKRRYHEIVQSLHDKTCEVIDGSRSTIIGREQAIQAWNELANDQKGEMRLVIYLPIPKPRSDEDRQRDPYQVFALGGGEFPEGDGESYIALCHQAAPELREQIDQLFEPGDPDFDTINSLIAGGANWPKLKTLLGAESATEILIAILSPDKKQQDGLEGDKSWVPELREFLQSTLGMELKSADQKLPLIQEELWRFVLYSEFAFDLPIKLPESLKDVTKATEPYRNLVYGVCQQLRSSTNHQVRYMNRAEEVAKQLQLERHMVGLADLGLRDTFAFEERTFLKSFTKAVLAGEYSETAKIIEHRRQSIWVENIAERGQLWQVADLAQQLIVKADDLSDMVKSMAAQQETLFEFYCEHFRTLDRIHRAFEQAIVDAFGELESLEVLVETARKNYLNVAQLLQSKFITAVKAEGWPVTGRTRNTQVFDKFVSAWLAKRKRVAYFMVDALRYELATELEKELSSRFKTEVSAVCAQLPTITPVGMAALLPGVDGKLNLKNEKGKIIPYVGEAKVHVPKDRFDYIQKIYGDRCEMRDLDDLVSKPKLKFAETVQLLVVKTTDIDQFGEVSPLEALRVIPSILQKIIRGVHQVQKKGFDRVVIATDHGFMLLGEADAGNDIPKPPGDWIVVKDRCLMGRGSPAPGVLVLKDSDVGIRGEFQDYAVPETFATYRKGVTYFHEGLSLQECVLPVITVDFDESVIKTVAPSVEMTLSYKGNTTSQITTRRPMVEISVYQKELGLYEQQVEFQLIAYADGDKVGEATSSPYLNPATNLVVVQPGVAIKVPLKMEDEYHGSFEVRAIDPETGVNHATLKLKTNYVD